MNIGEAGIPGVKPDEAGRIREQELRRAAKQLGIEVYFLDFLDGNLANTDQDKLFEYIACWIYTVDPQVILTFGPDGIFGHIDHVTISKIVTRVVNKDFPQICYSILPHQKQQSWGAVYHLQMPKMMSNWFQLIFLNSRLIRCAPFNATPVNVIL